jgi:hypothetical protein
MYLTYRWIRVHCWICVFILPFFYLNSVLQSLLLSIRLFFLLHISGYMQWPHVAIEAHEFEGQNAYFYRTSHRVSKWQYDRSFYFLMDLYFLNALCHFVIKFVWAVSELYSFVDGLAKLRHPLELWVKMGQLLLFISLNFQLFNSISLFRQSHHYSSVFISLLQSPFLLLLVFLFFSLFIILVSFLTISV